MSSIIRNSSSLGSVFFIFFLLGCNDDMEVRTRAYPVVNTGAATEINTEGVTFNGEILSIGLHGILDHGFVYDTEFTLPTVKVSPKISLGPTEIPGTFSAPSITPLTIGQTYQVRAYAISKENNLTVYGQLNKFKK